MNQTPESTVENRSDLLYGIELLKTQAQTLEFDKEGRLEAKRCHFISDSLLCMGTSGSRRDDRLATDRPECYPSGNAADDCFRK